MNRFILLSMLLVHISCRTPHPSDGVAMPHLEKRGSAVQLIVDGHPFIMLAGELHNSSASNADYLQKLWPKLSSMNLNTIIAPIYWELFEPAEGQFDFTLVDSLINGARRHGLKLVLLWFGTWKNTESSYVPAWVKGDQERFFRVQNSDGTKREIISPFCRAANEVDARAFARLMHHIEKRDKVEHTILMVQIENEVGLLGEPRDVCPQAESAYRQAVPDSTMTLFSRHLSELHPELRESWTREGTKTAGSWTEVFGADAAEFFMAWALADYIDRIAAVGKAIYPLPLFVNAWLRAPGQTAGQYPSGGPIDKVHDIWRVTAPHLDFFAPDIYLPHFKQICADYARNGNPLLIPEAHRNDHSIAQAMYALTQHNAMGFSPFGIDGIHSISTLQTGYRFLQNMIPILADYQGTGKMIGLLEENAKEEWVEWGDLHLQVSYDIYPKFDRKGYGFIIQTDENEFLVAGAGFELRFHPNVLSRDVHILQVDEMICQEGKLLPRRRLNGDETGANYRILMPTVIAAELQPALLKESTTHPPLPPPPDDFFVQRVRIYWRER